MQKSIFILFCTLFIFSFSFSQNGNQKIKAFAETGLFNERFNYDSLIPERRRGGERLGDVNSFGLQYEFKLGNTNWFAKTGLGFSNRHYSISKYSFGDIFFAFFLFDAPQKKDSFAINYVRFTNKYLQIPLSLSYNFSRRRNSQFKVGINLRSDFLLESKASFKLDSTNTNDIFVLEKAYTSDATKSIFTLEPYIEQSFRVYKNAGMYYQFRPFSFTSAKLNNRFTVSTNEFLSLTFGVFYDLK